MKMKMPKMPKMPKIPKIKIPTAVSKLLTNKYVLYIVAFLSLFSVISHFMMGHINMTILFVLIGYIMTFFSKNMVIVLLVPLVLVNLLVSMNVMKEGFTALEGQSTDSIASKAGNPKKKDNDIVSSEDVDAEGKMEIPDPTIHIGTEHPEIRKGGDLGSDGDLPSPSDEAFEVGRKKGGQSNINQPTRIDYGSTIEKAYDDLNDILGSEGIQRLTQDTQKLMKQQMQLADAMKGMTPLLNQAQSMMKSLNMDKLDLNALAKQLGVNNAVSLPKGGNTLIQKE